MRRDVFLYELYFTAIATRIAALSESEQEPITYVIMTSSLSKTSSNGRMVIFLKMDKRTLYYTQS